MLHRPYTRCSQPSAAVAALVESASQPGLSPVVLSAVHLVRLSAVALSIDLTGVRAVGFLGLLAEVVRPYRSAVAPSSGHLGLPSLQLLLGVLENVLA